MIDCLVIGTNMPQTEDHVETVRAIDNEGGAWRDLRLAFVEHEGTQLTAMDLINRVRTSNNSCVPEFSNIDFLWPAVSYLASYLSKRELSVDWVNNFQQEKELLAEKLTSNQVTSVAITTTLYVSPQPLIEIVQFVRRYSNAQIIVGGPYVASQADYRDPDELSGLFDYLGADIYVICSEGEQALASTVLALKNNSELHSIPNLAIRNRDNLLTGHLRTEKSVEDNKLEEEIIDYSLFSTEAVSEFLSLRTAKSCPYSCSFCGFPQRAGEYKTISTEEVEAELNRIRSLGTVTTLTFLDDTFNVPKKRFREIMRMMIRNNYGFRWNSFYRSDQGDSETIDLMRDAGCEGVFLGVESGSDLMLETMNKTARRKHYSKAIPLLQAAGISVHASLIIGFPGETDETVKESQSLIEENAPDFFRAQLWYCDHLTPIWKIRDQFDLKGEGFSWQHATMNSEAACDWVENSFFETQNSTWLPQYGFEQWSTFYLQRKGYSKQQIIDYLTLFNLTIKAQLADSKIRSIPDPIFTEVENIVLHQTENREFFSHLYHTPQETGDDELESFSF